jgi:pyruvate/2-oxoglutarate/acetoin dehydrogenase E1 component
MKAFRFLSDSEIYDALGKAFDAARIANDVPDKTVLAQGNVSSDALNKFRQNKGGITLVNFIKLMRGIGELDKIEAIFADVEKTQRQRIRKSDKPKKIQWGDGS